ncbi:MAG: tetratricopeptide repeat protein [Myxococcota bacterium]
MKTAIRRTDLRRVRHRAAVLGVGSLLTCLGVIAFGATAQDFDPGLLRAQPGEEADQDELRAFRSYQLRRPLEARRLGEEILDARPESYVAHYVVGLVQYREEANFPRALFHLTQARGLFEAVHGEEPAFPAPVLWHQRIMLSLAFVHGDLEHHEEKVATLELYNQLYDGKLVAEQAWPLMKMGRFDEARRTAERALEMNDDRQTLVALNALCAIEFETGNDGVSYEACRRALENGQRRGGGPDTVDLTNFAEAARSMFKLGETERVLLEASALPVSDYANPWLELSELYLREGRFAESLSALSEVTAYRLKRQPHVRDSDRNEHRRVLAEFFLLAGKPADAVEITAQAMVMPDRRAHNSRDPHQDRSVVALLDRRAQRMVAEQRLEEAAARPFWENLGRRYEAVAHRVGGWFSGRQAMRLLADDERLVGTFRIGTSKAAIMQPWLVGELVEVAGPGVVTEAIRRAREEDERPGSDGYYDAFEAEAALRSGDEDRCSELAARALEVLEPSEALLRARVTALAFESRRGTAEGQRYLEEALQIDPGVFRRLELSVPIDIRASHDPLSDDAADAIAWSPRFDQDDYGLVVTIDLTAGGGQLCLETNSGSVLSCTEVAPKPDESPDEMVRAAVDAFHEETFAPRVDLSQADINSLDGSNRVTRDPLEGLVPP